MKSKSGKKKKRKKNKTGAGLSRDEQRTMVLIVREHGPIMSTWQKLAAMFPSRSISELQDYYNDLMARARRKASKKNAQLNADRS